MQTNKISYPVNLGTSQWGTGNANTFIPFAQVQTGDGFYPVVWNLTYVVSGVTFCTYNFNLWWVGDDQFALQNADGPLAGYFASFWNNPTFTGLQAGDETITPEGTFGLENLGGGYVAIKYQGNYLSVYDNWYDWCFNIIFPVGGPPDANQTFNTGQPHFYILLISGSGVGLDLTGWNLADGGYIHSISDTDFTGANLTNANLSTLPDLSVASCKFNGATLTGAILTGVQNLNKATWKSANLAHTDLSHVDPNGVTGIDFSTLEQEKPVDLTGATLSNGKPLGANFNYGAANFNHANLTKATMDHINFVGAHFRGAKLTGANLTGADLSNADLTGADLTGATLAGTILTGAPLSGAIFDHCDLSTTVFGSAPKFGTSSDTRTRFRSATVPAPSLGLNWSYLDLTGATITDIPQSLTSLNADEALLPDQQNLQGVDFTNATFRGTRMYAIQLQGANLQGATMTDALLKGARLNGANLTMADLSRAWLIVETATPKTPVDQLEAASLTDAFMFNTVLDQAHCDGVDFSRANFSTSLTTAKSASAVNAYLNDAKFNDAWVAGAIFNGAQLSGANLANAHLIGTSFQNNGTRATELTPSIRSIGIDASTVNADIRGTDFTGAHMDGLDMDGAIVATKGDFFEQLFTGYKDASVLVSFNYGPTVFGNTTTQTICPDGQNGPCTVK